MRIKSRSVLAVDNDVHTLDRVSAILDASHVVLTTVDAQRGIAWLQNDVTICAVIVSQTLNCDKAMVLLQAAQRLRPDARRILIADHAKLAQLVEVLHTGAVQRTILKPIQAAELLSLIKVPASAVLTASPTVRASA